jgi:hypothetical protein
MVLVQLLGPAKPRRRSCDAGVQKIVLIPDLSGPFNGRLTNVAL